MCSCISHLSVSLSLQGWYGQLGHDTERSTDEPALVKYFHSRDMRVGDVVCGLWNTFVSAVPEKTSSHTE